MLKGNDSADEKKKLDALCGLIRRGYSMIDSLKALVDDKTENDWDAWIGLIYHSMFWLGALTVLICLMSPKAAGKLQKKATSAPATAPINWVCVVIPPRASTNNTDNLD